jgi:hypothetical protein
MFPVRLTSRDAAALVDALTALRARPGTALQLVTPPTAGADDRYQAVIAGVPGSAVGRLLAAHGLDQRVRAAWITPQGDLPVILTLPMYDDGP